MDEDKGLLGRFGDFARVVDFLEWVDLVVDRGFLKG